MRAPRLPCQCISGLALLFARRLLECSTGFLTCNPKTTLSVSFSCDPKRSSFREVRKAFRAERKRGATPQDRSPFSPPLTGAFSSFPSTYAPHLSRTPPYVEGPSSSFPRLLTLLMPVEAALISLSFHLPSKKHGEV